MGLRATAKGLDERTEFDCGYMTFGYYRMAVASAYNERFGELFKQHYTGLSRNMTDAERKELAGYMLPGGLAIFLNHADCEGKFTPKECRVVYNALKPLKVEMQGHNYGVMEPYDMHEHWLNIFKHCADRRVNLYFS